MAVGFVRVADGTGPTAIMPGDTLELWIDDIRLSNVVNFDRLCGAGGDVGGGVRPGGSAAQPDAARSQLPSAGRTTNLPEREHARTRRHAAHGEARSAGVECRTAAHSESHRIELGAGVPGGYRRTEGAESPISRTPRDAATTYTLVARRNAPITNSVFAPILNNLTATTTYTTSDTRDEYSDGTSTHFSLGLDYFVADDAKQGQASPGWMRSALGALPGFLQGGPVGALRDGSFRWNPSLFRLTSGITNNDDPPLHL